MLRVEGRGVLLLVAAVALRRSPGEFVPGMALRAWLCAMRTGQREWRQVVIERSAPSECRDAVAFFTRCAQPRGTVSGVCRGRIGRAMTPIAINRDVDVFLLLLVDMTGLAWERLVRADKREPGARMALCHIGDEPRLRRVAPLTSIAEFVAMDVMMAIGTHRRRAMELHRLMAFTARHLRVLSPEGETGTSVIEPHSSGYILPRGGSVAFFALIGNLPMGGRLGVACCPWHEEKKDEAGSNCANTYPVGSPSPGCPFVRRA